MSRFDELFREGAALGKRADCRFPFEELAGYLARDDFSMSQTLAESAVLAGMKTRAVYLSRLRDAARGIPQRHANPDVAAVFQRLSFQLGAVPACFVVLGLGGEFGASLKARIQLAQGIGRAGPLGILWDEHPSERSSPAPLAALCEHRRK